ncbi:MAG: periplasmic heavy metal sensor [Proteobacteria bacterium]|nr:periplasmic heavy metal sensor [Pseudomonadota bacterium]
MSQAMTGYKKKIFGALIIFSVLLNVFFIGGIASLIHRFGFPPMPPSPIVEFQHAARSLPRDSQDKVEAIISKHQEGIDGHFTNMKHIFPEMFNILTAETFDLNAFEALRQRMASTGASINLAMKDMVLEIVAALPNDQRIAFFEKAAPPRPPFMTPTEK